MQATSTPIKEISSLFQLENDPDIVVTWRFWLDIFVYKYYYIALLLFVLLLFYLRRKELEMADAYAAHLSVTKANLERRLLVKKNKRYRLKNALWTLQNGKYMEDMRKKQGLEKGKMSDRETIS